MPSCGVRVRVSMFSVVHCDILAIVTRSHDLFWSEEMTPLIEIQALKNCLMKKAAHCDVTRWRRSTCLSFLSSSRRDFLSSTINDSQGSQGMNEALIQRIYVWKIDFPFNYLC